MALLIQLLEHELVYQSNPSAFLTIESLHASKL